MSIAKSNKAKTVGVWSAVALVLAAIVAVPYIRGRMEPVTRERLDAARNQWTRANIADYDLELETSGAMSGRYHIEVRDGKLSRMTRNGQVEDPAAGEYWTVDGLFRVIEEYMDGCEQPGGGMFLEGSQVVLHMRCDRELGYPLRFLLHVKQPGRRSTTGYESTGATHDVEIRVTRLQALNGT